MYLLLLGFLIHVSAETSSNNTETASVTDIVELSSVSLISAIASITLIFSFIVLAILK